MAVSTLQIVTKARIFASTRNFPFICFGTISRSHRYNSRMQLGLLSRTGWTVVNDSGTALFDGSSDWLWRIERMADSGLDLYLFASGNNYISALGNFTALSGPIPLKPWRAHGVWHSREMPISETTVRWIFKKYEDYGLALNMFVLDYGWHIGPPTRTSLNPKPCTHTWPSARPLHASGPYDPQDVGACNATKRAGGQCEGGYGGAFAWMLVCLTL